MRKILFGVFLTFFLAFSSLIFPLFVLFLSPLILLHQRWFRSICNQIEEYFFTVVIACSELAGTKTIFSGDFPDNFSHSSILLSNHRTESDWFHLFSFYTRFGDISALKITAKRQLKNIPVLGVMTQIFSFLFLFRNWSLDEIYMIRYFNYMKSIKLPLQMLLFPEGTDLDPNSLKRSQTYSLQIGQKPFHHVLYPRTTGSIHIIQQMSSQLQTIYDVTIGYPKNIPHNPADLLWGNFPAEVHFHIQKYDFKTLQKSWKSEEDIQNWIHDLWTEKEARLEAFYRHKAFEAGDFAKAANSHKLAAINQKIRLKYILYSVLALPIASFSAYTLLFSRPFQLLYLLVYCTSFVVTCFGGLVDLEIHIFEKFSSLPL